MIYNIISSGSKGNAVVIEDRILIDAGVSFKSLSDVFRGLSLVLLTHIHGDHFNKSTIKKLAYERPTLRWACGAWLVENLVEVGVQKKNIDILEMDKLYDYGLFKVSPVRLTHNVPNCGYRIFINDKKLFYATDTGDLKGIEAKNYDLYMVEANHEIDEIIERIKQKLHDGIYAYEMDAIKNHLSKEKADEFIYSNIGSNGEYIYMHQHIDLDLSEG